MAAVVDQEHLETEGQFVALANEHIVHILKLELLSYKDICRLSRTCRRFNTIANSREIWRVKCNQRWNTWKHKTSIDGNWKDTFKRRITCDRELFKEITAVIKRSYKKECLQNKDLKTFAEFCDGHEDEDFKHVENTFEELLSTHRFKDLTLKYYARKIYTFVKQHLLTKEWCSFLCKHERDQKMIKGAMLIAKWCGRDINETQIHGKLEEIVSLVKNKMIELQESGTTKSEPFKQDAMILEAIRQVMFEDLGFKGNNRSYYDVNNSLIDKVLELRTGIPITLSIVFAAVAQSFGIYLEPVNFPTHFLLRYCSSNEQKHKYIDAFNGGKIMEEHDCIQILPYESRSALPRKTLFPTATSKQVFIRMVANMINTYRSSNNIDGRSLDKLRGALELMLLLNPDDEENRLMLSRIYLHHAINLDEVVENLRQLSSSTRGSIQTGLLASLLGYAIERREEEGEAAIVPKYRSDPQNADVQYRIGMVMHHRRYHYFCVIYGWDSHCNMEESWRLQMGVYNLTNGAEQPFYNVLADDESSRYASQENLVPINKTGSFGRPIAHPDIGKHFDEFNGLRYIPNAMLAEAYPEDGEIPQDLLPAKPYERMNDAEPMEDCS